MKLFGFALSCIAFAALSSESRAQSLAENATASAISLELARRATSAGSSTLNRAKKNLAGVTQPGRDPFGPLPSAGQPAQGQPAQSGALPGGFVQPPAIEAPPPPPAPWLWRLKGFVSKGRIRMAVWQAPDGIWRSAKVGEMLDERSKVVSISSDRVMVVVDGKKLGFSPW